MTLHHGTWRDWIILLAAAYLLFSAMQGLATGKTTLFYRTVARSEDGYLFWFAVVIPAVLGIAAVLIYFL